MTNGFACDICNGPTIKHLPFRGIAKEDPLEVEAFSGKWIWRCEKCDHASCHPKPDAAILDRYYEESFWAPTNRTLLTRIKWMIRNNLPVWNFSKREPRATFQFECFRPFIDQRGKDWLDDVRTLEIGAGNAAFTRLIGSISARPTLHVIEPGEQFTPVYRTQKIKRVARRFEELNDGQTYDLLHCSHWLEHMADVRAVFRRFAAILATDGLLYIEVPNCADPYWVNRFYPDPPHLQFFTPDSLSRLADLSGFGTLYLGTGGQPLKLSAEAGYLRADTDELITFAERETLLRERSEALTEKVKGRPEDGNFQVADNHEYIRIVLIKNH